MLTLGRLGLPQPEWLNHPETAVIAVVIVLLWSGVGYDMVIFLAGLQTIPREYYEAAQIDGASALRQFRDITLPLLTPTTFFLTVVAIIGSLQVFDLVYVMTRVGNATASRPSSTTSTRRGSRTSAWATPSPWPGCFW